MKKKIIIISAATVAAIVIAVFLAIAVSNSSRETATTEEHFRTPDYSLDITTVSEYMDKDRFITYTFGAESIGLNESNRSSFGAGVSFFTDYFDTLINGDTEAYNALFSEEYYKRHDAVDSFTKQMIYEPEVEKIRENGTGGVTEYVFAVTYKIYKNDGTFRREIGSDGAKVQYFYLSDESGAVLINNVTDKYE